MKSLDVIILKKNVTNLEKIDQKQIKAGIGNGYGLGQQNGEGGGWGNNGCPPPWH